MADYDVAIIGGGLNGTSVARDAAGRGLRVILLEQGDLGSVVDDLALDDRGGRAPRPRRHVGGHEPALPQ